MYDSDSLLAEFRKTCVPKLSSQMHKGQCGRVAVVGGSAEYTGAPYFAGITALRCDGLHFITQDPSLIIGYEYATLTPNIAELARLCTSVLRKEVTVEQLKLEPQEFCRSLASNLGGVTLVAKGNADIVTDGTYALECKTSGSARRCGGQGDVLSGALALFQFWAKQAPTQLTHASSNVVGAFAACALTRRCSQLAFEINGRATITQDLVGVLPKVVSEVLDGVGS